MLLAFPHTIFGAFATAAMLAIGICAFQLLRNRGGDVVSRSMRLALPIGTVAVILTMIFGHFQGILMETQQPMKMASAEVLYNTKSGASFSIFATGSFTRHPGQLSTDLRIPHTLSILATATWNGTVDGINQIQAAETKKYGPGDYKPILGVTYWTFRLMIGAGTLMLLLMLAGFAFQRRKSLDRARWFERLAIVGIFLQILANWTGWIFTETGRQPWVVYGLLKTSVASSPNVASGDIIATLAGYILIYGVVIVIGGRLMLREIKHGPEPPPPPPPAEGCSRTCLRPRIPTSSSPTSETDIHTDPDFLQTLWFVLIGVLWVGYFILEGFDFGVGMLVRSLGRDKAERRALIHTIGPVWDGKEVWLLTAGDATFAAFPSWYATTFSGFYLALLLLLAALIVRGVSFEFWGKVASERWRTSWEWAMCISSGRRRSCSASPGPTSWPVCRWAPTT